MRITHALYWKQKHEEVDALFRKHGSDVLGVEDYKQFYLHVSGMLYLINEKCVPREMEKVQADDFSMVRALVEKAML